MTGNKTLEKCVGLVHNLYVKHRYLTYNSRNHQGFPQNQSFQTTK